LRLGDFDQVPQSKFKVGDHVERIGSLVPQYMRSGVVTRVIPNKDGLDLFTEYEVNFDNELIATFYQTQLRLANNGVCGDPATRS
jgi:hypothetical protein